MKICFALLGFLCEARFVVLQSFFLLLPQLNGRRILRLRKQYRLFLLRWLFVLATLYALRLRIGSSVLTVRAVNFTFG
jgi:hypothetical protein